MLAKTMRALRGVLPKTFRARLYRAGDFFGFTPEERFPSVWATLSYLKRWGFEPSTVVDVGAYHGEWTGMLKSLFPSAEVLMVEAQEGKREILRAVCEQYGPSVTFESALLGPTDGAAVEFVEMGTGSSVLEERSHFARNRVLKETATLDALVRRARGWEKVDFLKLDVQGYELEVLKGASETLKNCELVLMEASLIPVNKDCPLIADVISFMRASGFRLLDFCSQIRRRDGALWQTDLMFIREGSAFLPRAELDSSNW